MNLVRLLPVLMEQRNCQTEGAGDSSGPARDKDQSFRSQMHTVLRMCRSRCGLSRCSRRIKGLNLYRGVLGASMTCCFYRVATQCQSGCSLVMEELAVAALNLHLIRGLHGKGPESRRPPHYSRKGWCPGDTLSLAVFHWQRTDIRRPSLNTAGAIQGRYAPNLLIANPGPPPIPFLGRPSLQSTRPMKSVSRAKDSFLHFTYTCSFCNTGPPTTHSLLSLHPSSLLSSALIAPTPTLSYSRTGPSSCSLSHVNTLARPIDRTFALSYPTRRAQSHVRVPPRQAVVHTAHR